LAAGKIMASRYENYLQFREELSGKRPVYKKK
jgi:ribosome biogenesis GTPase